METAVVETKTITLNRFPILAAFSCRAARAAGYTEDEARAIGLANSTLYAIFKGGGHAIYPGKGTKKGGAVVSPTASTEEAKAAQQSKVIRFGGQSFQVVLSGDSIEAVLVGGEKQDALKYRRAVENKFPAGYYERAVAAFDALLSQYSVEELGGATLFQLYQMFRDRCKVGFNRVDLDGMIRWCHEQRRA